MLCPLTTSNVFKPTASLDNLVSSDQQLPLNKPSTMFFTNIVIGLATAASLTAAAPTPNTDIRSPEVEGGPGSSSWPPSWKREVEGGPGSSSWPPSWKREEQGGPGSSSWPPSWKREEEKRTEEGGPGSSSWPPSWKRKEEGGPGSSSWPPSWKRDE